MKNTIKKTSTLLGIGAILFITSCNLVTEKEHQEKVASIEASNNAKIDSMERIYLTTIDEIATNLDEIRDKQGYIILGASSNADNVGLNKRDKIINNIKMVSALLDDNKKKIAELEKSLGSYKQSLATYKIGKEELIKLINSTKERVEQQEKDMIALKDLLEQRNFFISELNQKVIIAQAQTDDLSVKNATMKTEMNKVYVAVGSMKDLKRYRIVKRESGIAGIFGQKEMNSKINKAVFAQLDKEQNTSIPLTAKKIKLISQHPADSYKIGQDRNGFAKIEINNPDEFWSVSKYLVVETL